MASIADAIRERLATAPGGYPPDMVLVEREYLLALLQLLGHKAGVKDFGALEMDVASYTAKYAGTNLLLTKDMFLTLYAIVSKPHGATYREIYDLCKGKGFIAGESGRFEVNVRTMIKRLRRRLHRFGLSDQVIVNRPGVGYCWDDPSSGVAIAESAINDTVASLRERRRNGDGRSAGAPTRHGQNSELAVNWSESDPG